MEKQIEACARRGDAQDAEIGTAVAAVSKMREELKEGCVPCGERGHQLIRESGVAQAKLAAQEAQINELSATVAQLMAPPQTRPMPVDAAETAAARRLQTDSSGPPWTYVMLEGSSADYRCTAASIITTVADCQAAASALGLPSVQTHGGSHFQDGCSSASGAVYFNTGPARVNGGQCVQFGSVGGSDGSCGHNSICGVPSPSLPPAPPPSPLPPLPPTAPPLSPPPPAWPPLPATANELRISGRHTAIAFNTNVDGVEVFRCVGVGDGKLTCSGELRAADFRTADGISLATVAELGDSLIGSHAALNSTLNAVGEFVGMVPPSSPYLPSYLYLGEGQCRNVDGNSPTWTDRGRMTESACMQAALNANVLPVAIECNGGRPNNCWCQHFTSGPVVQLLPEDGTSAHGTFGCWLLSSPQAPNMALLSAWMSQAAKLHR